MLHLLISTPILYDVYNYDSKSPEFALYFVKFTQVSGFCCCTILFCWAPILLLICAAILCIEHGTLWSIAVLLGYEELHPSETTKEKALKDKDLVNCWDILCLAFGEDGFCYHGWGLRFLCASKLFGAPFPICTWIHRLIHM